MFMNVYITFYNFKVKLNATNMLSNFIFRYIEVFFVYVLTIEILAR